MGKPIIATVALILTIVNSVLVVLSLAMSSLALMNRPRFARTDQPLVMFDNKTGRACSAVNRLGSEPVDWAQAAKEFGGVPVTPSQSHSAAGIAAQPAAQSSNPFDAIYGKDGQGPVSRGNAADDNNHYLPYCSDLR